MARELTVSLDGMGGDHGPAMIIEGADIALVRHPTLRFLIFGNEALLKPVIDSFPRVAAACELIHTEVAVAMDEKPSQALRQGRKTSSMWQAIEAVKQGRAEVVVSAGNTGALMAMAKVILKTMPHIERPAIAGLWPTLRGECVVLDLGATINPDAKQLVQFAIMGEAYARVLFNIERPSVGILNVGEEEVKGTEQVKAAAQMLRNTCLPIDFYGFVEGDDIGKGTVDVVVTDGFTGNIALKTAEGTVRQVMEHLRNAIRRSFFSRIGYFLAQGAFQVLRAKMDPRSSNGGLFLGLDGLVVKSHGSTDAIGFASAIDVAVEVAEADLLGKISAAIDLLGNSSAADNPGGLAKPDEPNAEVLLS